MVLIHGLQIGLDYSSHLFLLFGELVLLVVKFLSLFDDLLFLFYETLVYFSLFTFFLEKTNGLKWSLTLHDESSHLVQVFVGDLRLGILPHLLVDSFEELLDLILLVNIHFLF